MAALLALVAVACSGPPTPIGWAAASPVVLEDQEIVLVPNDGQLTALAPTGVVDGSGFSQWTFPPRDRDLYPVSTFSADEIKDAIDGTTIEDGAKEDLAVRVDDLRVSGPTKEALQDAINASLMTDDQKDSINSLIDQVTEFESGAVRNLEAIYGDIGVSADGDTAYVASFRGFVYALDTKTGTTRWLRDAQSELVSGVAVDGDTIYTGTRDGQLVAAEAADGDTIWAIDLEGEAWATPYVDGDNLYATSLDGIVYKVNKETGDEIWRFEGAKSGIAGRIGKDDETVYIGAFDNKLYAINDRDGTMKWSFEADNWFWATPIERDGVVYAASLDGKMYAVNTNDGSPAWPSGFDTGAPIRSAPVFGGDGLLVVSRDGKLFKLDLESGDAIEGSPALIGDGSTVEADLALDENELLYVVPRDPSLWIFEVADGLRSRGDFPLP